MSFHIENYQTILDDRTNLDDIANTWLCDWEEKTKSLLCLCKISFRFLL